MVSEINELIKSLNSWNKLTADPKVNDFKSLLESILLSLGSINDSNNYGEDEILEEIEERMLYLVDEEFIDEDLLVMAIVNFVKERLEDTIMKQGDMIVTDENLLFSNKVDLNMKHRLSNSLNKLRNNHFYEKGMMELDQWKTIVSTGFTRSNRNRWKEERLEINASELEEEIGEIPLEILEILADIPIIKLMDLMPIDQIKDLSYEEALKVKNEL
ncbi:hypothetical protein [Orenia marismortui]|uniref:hypothetical protein n=1 Tax=Orenia marismortui TaxID=46469 RepID=UPI0003734DB0|nr:hypothetical protein [Orenia marismortui]